MKRQQQEIDRDVQLEVPDSPDDYVRAPGERTETTPQTLPATVPANDVLRLPARSRQVAAEGSLQLDTELGRRQLSAALVGDVPGPHELGLRARPRKGRPVEGDTKTIRVTHWIAVPKAEVQFMDGETGPGLAVTLFDGELPVLSWVSTHVSRQWVEGVLSRLGSDGPWPDGVAVDVIAHESAERPKVWYSLSLGAEQV